MSNIFLQKDNITILGDIRDYSIESNPNVETVIKKAFIETVIKKALLLQIIIVINWKQKIFKVSLDLENNPKTALDNWSLKLKDYTNWYILRDFLETIGYDIDFNISEKIEWLQEIGI